MKRRKFITASSLATASLMVKGIPVKAASYLESQVMGDIALAAANCGKILVIIQQNGGNDGLNTIFPMDQWSNLYSARTNILMDQTSVLALSGNPYAGVHPSMPEIQNLYNNGKVMIVQGVSYPNPSYSHFRATDIWFTASGSSATLETGWLGRALDTIYTNYPDGYPNAQMPDPLAIQIGSQSPFSLQGQSMNLGYNVPDPSSLINVVNGMTDPAPNDDYGHELTFLRLMKDQSNAYRNAIQTAYNMPQSQTATYPSNNRLADQLRIVAKLINGGLKTPIYIVNHPRSHDSHENQVDPLDRTQGIHADNLKVLSQAIGAFQQDLELMGKDQYVTGMTFSEFGRRIISNASNGTDHGAGAPVLFFGSQLNTNPSSVAGTAYPTPGMIGSSPIIPANANVSHQVSMQFDFRQLYTTIMQDWLCMDETEADGVLGAHFTKLPIFKYVPTSITDFDNKHNNFISVYPNPVTDHQITIQCQEVLQGNAVITIFNMNGRQMQQKVQKIAGKHLSFALDPNLAAGNYLLKFDFNNHIFTKKIVIK